MTTMSRPSRIPLGLFLPAVQIGKEEMASGRRRAPIVGYMVIVYQTNLEQF